MTISKTDFGKMIPSNKNIDEWYEVAIPLFKKYGINTRNRIAGFMAQAGHESSDFNVLIENLNYSWTNLRKIFGRYFPTDTMAKQYQRKPEEIANIVYNDANRISKLGNTQPGDGWKFRGRGIFQITGRDNYTSFARYMNMDVEDVIKYLETKKGAMESAIWFWNNRNLNRFADNDDILGMSRTVNGGDNGLNDRKQRYTRNKSLINEIKSEVISLPNEVKRGMTGEIVMKIQRALGLSNVDGIFGIGTDAAVRSWQRNNKYFVNGILDSNQLKKLIGE